MAPFLKLNHLAATLGCALLLASCATMSPEECQLADWREVGLRDGLRGEPLALLGKRANDCSKVAVAIDQEAYQQGRAQGLRNYCRPDQAVPLGLSGAGYASVCPPETEALFVPRYQAGRAVYVLRAELQSLTDGALRLERRLIDLRRDEELRLRNAGTDPERSKVRRDIEDERMRIRNALIDTDRRTHHTRDALRAAEFRLTQVP
jgi:hypothetical protein